MDHAIWVCKEVFCVNEEGLVAFWRAQGWWVEIVEQDAHLAVAEFRRVKGVHVCHGAQRRDEAAVERRDGGGGFADKEDELELLDNGGWEECWISLLVRVEEMLQRLRSSVGRVDWGNEVVGHVFEEDTFRIVLEVVPS